MADENQEKMTKLVVSSAEEAHDGANLDDPAAAFLQFQGINHEEEMISGEIPEETNAHESDTIAIMDSDHSNINILEINDDEELPGDEVGSKEAKQEEMVITYRECASCKIKKAKEKMKSVMGYVDDDEIDESVLHNVPVMTSMGSSTDAKGKSIASSSSFAELQESVAFRRLLCKKTKRMWDEVLSRVIVKLLKRMPMVSTNGGIENGEMIQGFLFKYNGGNPTIVCACHGQFLGCAEFVQHAGGSADVDNPSKFIDIDFFPNN